MTADEAREIALARPGAVEGEHHGHPDFRIGNKIFATLWPGRGTSVLRLPLALAESLAHGGPDAFKVVSRTSAAVWLSVTLERVDQGEFKVLAEVAVEHLRR